MENEMELLEKICNWVVWLLIVGSIFGFAYGTYEMIDLFLLRG